MKHYPTKVETVGDLGGLLMDLINGQNYQIHQFQGYLVENLSEQRFCKDDYEGKVYILDETVKCANAFPIKCNTNPLLQEFCPISCPLPCLPPVWTVSYHFFIKKRNL